MALKKRQGGKGRKTVHRAFRLRSLISGIWQSFPRRVQRWQASPPSSLGTHFSFFSRHSRQAACFFSLSAMIMCCGVHAKNVNEHFDAVSGKRRPCNV
jgi:hypothetical protein